MKITPLKLLLIGLVITLIGAFMRVLKIEYAIIVILAGLLTEVSAGVQYFISHSKK